MMKLIMKTLGPSLLIAITLLGGCSGSGDEGDGGSGPEVSGELTANFSGLMDAYIAT